MSTTPHPLYTRESRFVWFNSVLEALALSEDYLGYVQDLIFTSISPGSPFLSEYNNVQASIIPELIVSLSKGDYLQVVLHDEMVPILHIFGNEIRNLIKKIKKDQSLGLKLNLTNIFAEILKEWIDQGDEGDEGDQGSQNDQISLKEFRQFLLILLSIASLNLYTQVNYSGLPLILPVSLQQYKNNDSTVRAIKQSGDSLDQIDEENDELPSLEDEDGTIANVVDITNKVNAVTGGTQKPTLQTKINTFFALFSTKSVSSTADVLDLTSKDRRAVAGNKKRWINVEKTILLNAALKVNGEDTYQCSHYPLFLVIARAILGAEGLLVDMLSIATPVLKGFNHCLKSVLGLEVQEHFHKHQNNQQTQQFSYFSCPSLLIYTLRSAKLHSEILLSPTATIRTEFYTLSLLYQLLYGVLSGPTPSKAPQSLISRPIEAICSEFTCIAFKPFHIIYTPGNSSDYNRIPSLFNTVVDLVSYFPQISFLDPLTGQDLSKTMVDTTRDLVHGDDQLTHSHYDAILLIIYNHFANIAITPSQNQTQTNTESNVDDIHAVGISPLTHSHTHANYRPILLFPTCSSSSTDHNNDTAIPTTQTIPYTLSTTLFTTITTELGQIALKLYLYKRSFLLLSMAKIFSGLSIYVSGVLGRRTRYQSRSYAQLHGISFLHKDIIKATEFDSRQSHLGTILPANIGDIDPKYVISTDITDSLAAQYVIPTDNAADLIPELVQESKEKFLQEKEKYKGVINERNPTIPRVSKLTHSEVESAEVPDEHNHKQTYALCVTRGGHVDDIPIDSLDDVYLAYMLPDSDNYNVDESCGKNLKNGQEIIDFDPLGDGSGLPSLEDPENVVVSAGGNLDGVVNILATAKNGVLFEGNRDSIADDYTSHATLQQIEPPLEHFVPYMQNSIGSVLALSVANYLYRTSPQNEITQQEQDCYLQTIFQHQFNQSNQYFDPEKNKHGNNYREYSSLLDFNTSSIPFSVILNSLMLRSVLEFTNSRLQLRSISQIELLTNLFVTNDENLQSIHFKPDYLPDLVNILHNIGVDSTKYHLNIRQVTKSSSSFLTYLYDNIHLSHHQFQAQDPVVYDQILTKTIRNLTKFRQNKVFCSFSVPWWEILRNCADLCTKAGYISTSLRCYVTVQLWSSVIDTLIQVGRRGDATKLLKFVLRVNKNQTSEELLLEYKENRRLEREHFEKLEIERKEREKEDEERRKKIEQDSIVTKAKKTQEFEFFADYSDSSCSDSEEMKEDWERTPPPSPTSGALSGAGMITIAPILFNKMDELDLDGKTVQNDETNSEQTSLPENDTNDDDVDEKSQNNSSLSETDSDYKPGSLLHFVANSMESTLFTTTTSSGAQTFSASKFRLFHLLGESTQDEYFWEIAWELSNYTYAPPQRSLGKWLAVRKRNEEAYQCYQHALKLNGSDHQTWYECGVVATRLGEYAKAIPCFSNALRIKPDISEGWNNLAACHIYLNNISSAYHALSQCLRGNNSSWKILENYLQCSLQLGYYNDVLSSLSHISHLKGKVDPLTLLPIQYTTSQSKFHVFALYATWSEHLAEQVKVQVDKYNNPDVDTVGPSLPNHLQNQQQTTNHNSCTLCTPILIDQYNPNQTKMDTLIYFPMVKKFHDTIQAILVNISHNESRESEMGGMIRGGGDDAGAGNSSAAQMDFDNGLRRDNVAQNDDDNAQNIAEGDHVELSDDELAQQGKFLQLLSNTAKGQKCILYYLLGLSTQAVSIDGDVNMLKHSAQYFENCINILIKILVENAYHTNYTKHIGFIITHLKHIINSAVMLDEHIVKHGRDYDSNPLTDDDRMGANNKELALLLKDRIVNGLQRDYNNNKANLSHVLPFIDEINTLGAGLKELCVQDDEFFKQHIQHNNANGSGESGGYEYDPYGSFY